MKTILPLLLCGFLMHSGIGQQTEYLFEKAEVIGGFGGPLWNINEIKSTTAISFGGGGGMIMDNFFIGGFGLGATQTQDNKGEFEEYHLSMGYGGLWFGFTPWNHKLIHPIANYRIGLGGASWSTNDGDPGKEEYKDDIIVLEPEIGVELNVNAWFRIDFLAGWRIVEGIRDIPQTTDKDLSSFTTGLTLRFGFFGEEE